MCNACVIESVKDSMMSRRKLFMGAAASGGAIVAPFRRKASAAATKPGEAWPSSRPWGTGRLRRTVRRPRRERGV